MAPPSVRKFDGNAGLGISVVAPRIARDKQDERLMNGSHGDPFGKPRFFDPFQPDDVRVVRRYSWLACTDDAEGCVRELGGAVVRLTHVQQRPDLDRQSRFFQELAPQRLR